MNTTALELFHSDGKPSGIWYCKECRSVFTDSRQAQGCHGVTHCESCGAPLGERQPYYRKVCEGCDNKAWRERVAKEEFERYQKATKIGVAEWKGEQVFFNDQYYPSVEEAIDDCDEPPEYVWAASNIGVRKASTEDLTERIIEDMWEDADSDDLNGLDELQVAVDAFNKANESIVCWMVDHSVAVVLDDEILKEWRAEREVPA